MSDRRKKPRRLGPFSGDEAIASADGRTKEGKFLSGIQAQLAADVGGDPTTCEWLLIQSIAVKALRLSLLTERLLSTGDLAGDPHHAMAWMNAMRQDIVALGLKRRARDVGLPGNRSTLRQRANGVTIDGATAEAHAA